jgi:agmatinase
MFVVKIPGINGENTEGCRNAGNAILNELRKIEINEQGKIVDVDLIDVEEIHLTNKDLRKDAELIYKNSFEIFETKPKTVFLGGDHSISFNLAKAFKDSCEQNKKEPCLIVFDSRANCMKEDDFFPKNTQWLRSLIEIGFPARSVLIVGIRKINREEEFFIKENRITRISANQLRENIEETCEVIMEFSQGKELYVSIDFSVLDPVFVPAATFNEVGGLTSREMIYLVQRMNKMKNLRVLDVVEIDSEKDKSHDNLTVKLGAKILSELI